VNPHPGIEDSVGNQAWDLSIHSAGRRPSHRGICYSRGHFCLKRQIRSPRNLEALPVIYPYKTRSPSVSHSVLCRNIKLNFPCFIRFTPCSIPDIFLLDNTDPNSGGVDPRGIFWSPSHPAGTASVHGGCGAGVPRGANGETGHSAGDRDWTVRGGRPAHALRFPPFPESLFPFSQIEEPGCPHVSRTVQISFPKRQPV
jgi:hypothetical protein